jgi:steroid delta-isomerase-like uncharacterized protein
MTHEPNILLPLPMTITVVAALAAAACASTTARTNKQAVQRLYESGINTGDLSLADQLIADDYVSPLGERGPAAFRRTISGLRAGFPDIHFTVEDLVAEGDRVAVRWTWRGTHKGPFGGFPPSDRPMTSSGQAVYQMKDGKVTRIWLETDRLGFLQQVGAVPAGLGQPPPRPSR